MFRNRNKQSLSTAPCQLSQNINIKQERPDSTDIPTSNERREEQNVQTINIKKEHENGQTDVDFCPYDAYVNV